MPARSVWHARHLPFDAVRDRPTVGIHVIAVPLSPFWLSLRLSSGLAGRHGGLPRDTPLAAAPLLGFGRTKQVDRWIAGHERAKCLLCLGPEGDFAIHIAPAVFVVERLVDPDASGTIDIAEPHRHDLTWPHTREPLQTDHRRNLGGDIGQDRLHGRPRHRPDGLGFSGLSVAVPKPRDCLEALVDCWGEEFFTNGPLKGAFDAADVVVDRSARKAPLHKMLSKHLQGLWTKLVGRCAAIETAKGAKGNLNALQLSREDTVLDVVRLGEPPIGQDQLSHRQLNRGWTTATGRHDGGWAAARPATISAITRA